MKKIITTDDVIKKRENNHHSAIELTVQRPEMSHSF